MKINYTIKDEPFKIGSWAMWPEDSHDEPGKYAYKVSKRIIDSSGNIQIKVLYKGKENDCNYDVIHCNIIEIPEGVEGVTYEN